MIGQHPRQGLGDACAHPRGWWRRHAPLARLERGLAVTPRSPSLEYIPSVHGGREEAVRCGRKVLPGLGHAGLPLPADHGDNGRPGIRVPYGNKEVAFSMGAQYGADGWYAPPGVDLDAFRERGWLY